MNYLDTKYDYGVVLCDNDVDRKIMSTLDTINDNLNKRYGAYVDLYDGDDKVIDGYVGMDKKMSYNYDKDILKDIQNVCDTLGIKVDIDNHPDVDMDCTMCIRYDVKIYLD